MTSPCMWSQRLHNLPMSSLSRLGFLHKAHLLIFITPGLPHWGNLRLTPGLRCPTARIARNRGQTTNLEHGLFVDSAKKG